MSEGRTSEDLGWDLLGASLVVAVFFGIAALIAMGQATPFDRLGFLGGFARELGLLLLAASIVSAGTGLFSKAVRWNLYDHGTAFVVLGLVASGGLTAAFAVRAAGTITSWAAPASSLGTVGLHFVGFLATVVAGQLVALLYYGTLYRLANLALGVLAYSGWALWLAFGRG